MAEVRARLVTLLETPLFPVLAVALVGIRFLAPTLTAALSVSGLEISGLDAAFGLYSGILPMVLLALVLLVAITWPSRFLLDSRTVLAIAFAGASALLWAGEVDPGLRLVSGPWAGTVLGLITASTIIAWTLALRSRLREASDLARDGFEALGLGFGLAYALRALRLTDYRFALGVDLPPGVLWVFDYGPFLVLSFLAVVFWFELTVDRARGRGPLLRAFLPPVIGAALAASAGTGMGGFILSHLFTWGGSYTIFAPTIVSLAIIGFAVGGFLAASWALRARLPRVPWRLLTAGVQVAALSGILTFGGTLSSLTGILLGVLLAARGIRGLPPSGGARSFYI